MKRFRIRPQRASDYHLVWLGGPDCGPNGQIKPLTIKRDCGAAIDFPFPAEQMSSDSFRKVVDTDLVGSFHACR